VAVIQNQSDVLNLRSFCFFVGQKEIWMTDFFFTYLNFVQLNPNLEIFILIPLSNILFKGG